VQVVPDQRQGGFHISPGVRSGSIREMGAVSAGPHLAAIERVAEEFGGLSAKELELRATVVFAERDARRRGSPLCEDGLVQVVHEIKPNFSPDQIRAALRELRGREYISTA
jgi:hypothetical protein